MQEETKTAFYKRPLAVIVAIALLGVIGYSYLGFSEQTPTEQAIDINTIDINNSEQVHPSIYTRLIKEKTSTITTPRLKSIVNTKNIKQANQFRKEYKDYSYFSKKTAQGRAVAGQHQIWFGGTYSKDPHLWAYTKTFASRFGMPKEWMTPTLQQAQALAYRIDWDIQGEHCTDKDRTQNCRPKPLCVIDMYLINNTVPWVNNKTHDSLFGRKSQRYIHDINDIKSTLSPIDNAEFVNYYQNDSQAKKIDLQILGFDKEIYKNLHYLSLGSDCQNFDQINTSKTNKIILTGQNKSYEIVIPKVLLDEINTYNKQVNQYQALFFGQILKTNNQVIKPPSYYKDNHVWVYTQAFATRFNLPKENIDNSLQGAQALAYRVDWDNYGVKCGYFRNLENCRPAPSVIVDIYFKDNILSWNSTVRYDGYYGYKSKDHIISTLDNDLVAYLYRRPKRYGSYYMGVDGAGISTFNGKGGLGNYGIMEYDKDIYAGLDYISGIASHQFGEIPDIDIRFYAKKDGKIAFGDPIYTTNKVRISKVFKQKIKRHNKQVYEPNSLFNAVKEKLQAKTTKQ